MANLVKTGLGGHRIAKEAEKREGYYWTPPLWVPGVGITFSYKDVTTKEDLDAATHDAQGRKMYPQASQTHTALEVTTSGFSGTASGTFTTMTIVNGLITDVS